jgi:hypothetical protein
LIDLGGVIAKKLQKVCKKCWNRFLTSLNMILAKIGSFLQSLARIGQGIPDISGKQKFA